MAIHELERELANALRKGLPVIAGRLAEREATRRVALFLKGLPNARIWRHGARGEIEFVDLLFVANARVLDELVFAEAKRRRGGRPEGSRTPAPRRVHAAELAVARCREEGLRPTRAMVRERIEWRGQVGLSERAFQEWCRDPNVATLLAGEKRKKN